MSGSSTSTSAKGTTQEIVQEFSVRVPNRTDRPMSVMRFNGALNVDIAKWANLKMLRDDHSSKTPKFEPFVDTTDLPKFGAGSEYGREAREEARRRKYGQFKKKINAEDHPWLLKAQTADKQSRRFKGVREGTISTNASYFIFTQAPDGQFEVFPVSQWYNFTPIQTYKALSAEEAEEEFGKRNKILNLFSVMVRKRMRGDEVDGGEKDEDEGKKKGGASGSGLKVSEMEDWDDVHEMDSEDEDDDDEPTTKKKVKKSTNKKKERKGSGEEDSDDGDGEGREVDYISDSSFSESDAEGEKDSKVEMAGVDQESGLRDLLESDSSEEENPEEKKDNEEGETEDGESKPKKPKKKKKKTKGEAQASDSISEDSDDADPDAISVVPESESSAKLAVAELQEPSSPENEESRKRKAAAIAGATQPSKKPKMEINPVLLQSAASEGITEEAVRRYLIRKPMTATELLQKFKSKKTKVSSKDMVTVIASILKKINPAKRMQNQKMYLYLKN